MGLADQIDQASDSDLRELEIPEWPAVGKIWLRQWTGEERNRAVRAREDEAKLQELVLMLSICDEAGRLAYDEKSVKKLMKKNHLVLKRITEAALSHNSLSGDAAAEAKKN